MSLCTPTGRGRHAHPHAGAGTGAEQGSGGKSTLGVKRPVIRDYCDNDGKFSSSNQSRWLGPVNSQSSQLPILAVINTAMQNTNVVGLIQDVGHAPIDVLRS